MIVDAFIKNPSAVDASGNALKILEGSRKSGRAHAYTSLKEMLDHEMGHALFPQIQRLQNYQNIERKWMKYAERVSGEATIDIKEYIAESFVSWKKGERLRDEEIIKAFNAMKR